jgi:type II secretory pathway pseudopilin PulG
MTNFQLDIKTLRGAGFTPPLRARAGFTMIEAVISIGIIMVAIVGILILLHQSFRSVSIAENRMIAAQLAQEGIEVIVAIRDSNWAAGQPWRTNLPATVGTINYNSTTITQTSNPTDWCLSIVGGLYRHTVPPCNTLFSRHVELVDQNESINGTPTDYLEVRSIVEWQDKDGIARSINIVDHLYDWQ